jgi:hypothetical protein
MSLPPKRRTLFRAVNAVNKLYDPLFPASQYGDGGSGSFGVEVRWLLLLLLLLLLLPLLLLPLPLPLPPPPHEAALLPQTADSTTNDCN